MTKFLFGMCNCTVDVDVSRGDFLVVLGILHMCGHASAIARAVVIS